MGAFFFSTTPNKQDTFYNMFDKCTFDREITRPNAYKKLQLS